MVLLYLSELSQPRIISNLLGNFFDSLLYLDLTSFHVLLRGYQRPVKPVPGDCGYHLHAHQLVLSHPTTSEVIRIAAPLPSVLRTQEESKEMKLSDGDNAK